MAKAATSKKPAARKATTTPVTRHARIELSSVDYERLRDVAKSQGLAVAAYIRQAVLQKVRRDETGEA